MSIYQWTPTGGQNFDTLVRLWDSGGNEVTSNDDNASAVNDAYSAGLLDVGPASGTYFNYNSAIVAFTPTQSGTYTVVADSYGGYGIGGYRLKVVNHVVPPTPTPAPTSTPQPAVQIDIGQEVSGSLPAGQEHLYTIDLQSGSPVSIYQWSPAGGQQFDTFVRLRSPGGAQIATNDDAPSAVNDAYSAGLLDVGPSGNNVDSAIVGFTPTQSGTYTVVADAYGSSGTGDYRLKVINFAVPPTPTPAPTSTATPTPAPTATPAGSSGLPASLTVAVDSGQGWGGWGNGTYTRCTGVPCGALDVSTWNGEAIYVKPSGVTSDPTHDWYWAYIDKFRPSGYFEVWTIAYVAPRFDASDPDCARDDGWCWNVHSYCVGGCSDPWGDWGDLTVTANY